MIETGRYDRVWDEFRRQLDFKGLKVKRGTIQDASFIEDDPVHRNCSVPATDNKKVKCNLKDGGCCLKPVRKEGKLRIFGALVGQK